MNLELRKKILLENPLHAVGANTWGNHAHARVKKKLEMGAFCAI